MFLNVILRLQMEINKQKIILVSILMSTVTSVKTSSRKHTVPLKALAYYGILHFLTSQPQPLANL